MFSPEEVARCCTSAMLLELATTPKPGLVDRNSSPERFSQFTISAVGLHQRFREVASKQIGECILSACRDMMKLQTGGNTHLGSILLLMPMAKAACSVNDFYQLRTRLGEVLKNMKQDDLIKIVQAISLVNPGGLGKVAFLDVKSPKTHEIIRRRNITVLEAFKPYVEKEVVAREYVSGYRTSFFHGYFFLKKMIAIGDWNTAGVDTFLNLLAHNYDTHVSRRHGFPAARMLSRLAEEVLKSGGYGSCAGRRKFEDFAELVKRSGFKPASTADLLCVAYFLLLLDGWRP